MLATDLTVAAVIENDGRFLMVEERALGNRVISQPGGHIEADESAQFAVEREVLEETGCTVECGALLGTYLWIHPQTRQQYLRLIYVATFVSCDESLPLDTPIIGRHWMTLDEISSRKHSLRSPVVLRCLQDYKEGKRAQEPLPADVLPVQRHVHRMLATADLV